jgi:hypothetical protein
MFIARTVDGLLIGPFSSYDTARDWIGLSIFSRTLDEIHVLLNPRPDMLRPLDAAKSTRVRE